MELRARPGQLILQTKNKQTNKNRKKKQKTKNKKRNLQSKSNVQKAAKEYYCDKYKFIVKIVNDHEYQTSVVLDEGIQKRIRHG